MVQELSGGRSGGQGLKVWVLERYNSRTLMDSYTGSLIKLQCNHSISSLYVSYPAHNIFTVPIHMSHSMICNFLENAIIVPVG